MFKNSALSFLLIMTFLISGQAFCQDAANNQDEATVAGQVVDLDLESGLVRIKAGDEIMDFYIQTESRLYKVTHLISAIEIKRRDPVTIQYFRSEGQNKIINLVDNKPLSGILNAK